ncbi:hypothetical protein BAUCODRAFT_145194 [Baudoinia panamericana UAMH 10762]|uniref:Uncharacterized protein n=1 Tax=Baudoinia panamericana (strain UAMH 10762) TaxID=717646 RepID=M2NKZ9_BAUPA|nr:uncharacterized protein BAUCODRAFT_145194 [Baudoinia panamericana UAMH 10762]EMC99825.1 hypothetical protein BAUCODRAFT_145194 [Baudoinia panamericana UAMH 10762]
MSTQQLNGTTAKLLVLVTGANQGLGYYASQQLASTGKYHIFLGSRDLNKAHKAIQQLVADDSVKVSEHDLEPIQINVTSDDSIKAAAKHVADKYGYLDILMNNAGIAAQQAANADGTGPTLRELYHRHYDTNLFGAAVVTEAFLPLLKKSTTEGGKRIAFTSSALSSLEWAATLDGEMSGANYPLYRSTKTAENMVMIHYARSLEAEGFVVSASDPGYCATNLNYYHGAKDPRQGAKALVIAATGVKEQIHGRVVDDESNAEPW